MSGRGSTPHVRVRAFTGGLVAALMLGLAWAPPVLGGGGFRTVSGDTPAPIASGSAVFLGGHDSAALLRLNVGLQVRDSVALDALIRAASTPGPQRDRYLTNAQYMTTYAPTRGEVQATSAWLSSQGLTVTGVSPDNLLVHVTASVAAAEAAFGMAINDYRLDGRSFYSNDRDPSVPSGLPVTWISGLSDFQVFQPADTCVTPPSTNCGLDGTDVRNGYDVVGNGSGQTIGFTLWGGALPQSDYTAYASATGTTALVVGQAGDDGIDFVQVDGAGTNSMATDSEIALDTENAHSVAPGIHETYWLGKDNSYATLEDVLNTAANSTVPIISNSWGTQTNPCPVDANMEASLQHGAATGKTFFFSTGDGGASAGCEYPAESQYVVAVGGTALILKDPGDVYTSETAINNGGGCLGSEPRPAWQTGIGTAYTWGSPPATCSGRAIPDVAAISGFCTDGSYCGPGAYVYFDGAGDFYGGTSLATPVWAAAATVWSNHNAATGRPSIGFVAPVIYALANDPTTYARDFHDVTTGTNGFGAATGWDEATGWGSADFSRLSNNVADVTYTGPTQANQGDTITLSATLLDHGAATPLATAALGSLTLALTAAGSSCIATVDATGHASCSVTVNDTPGTYKAIAAYAGDVAYQGGSDTVDFTVLHVPTKVTFSGAYQGDYNDEVTLSGNLIDDSGPTSFSSGDPIPGETVTFSFGAESCSGVTDATGSASCTVTPLDLPASSPYAVTASFAGDEPIYEPSSDATQAFVVQKEESALSYTGPTSSHYHDTFTPSATLTDPIDHTGIADKTVTFALGRSSSDTCSAVTDSSGVASCTITPTQTGSPTLTVSFAGDADYVSSGTTSPVSITPEETTMTYTGPTTILAGAGGATLTATLVEDGATDDDADGGSAGPVPAEPVTLSLGSQSCTATTDASGQVSCTLPSVDVPLGPETIEVSFAGDAYYQAASASTMAIVFAFPSGGVFTLGDQTVANAGPATSVTWWSNDWYLQNDLSGGPAPAAFKGFAGSVHLPEMTPAGFCGDNWTSSVGNSGSPPATVPSYMGVIVTTTVAQTHGSTIRGDYVEIVVVQTEPGYAPGPANTGTGAIVATFCSS